VFIIFTSWHCANKLAIPTPVHDWKDSMVLPQTIPLEAPEQSGVDLDRQTTGVSLPCISVVLVAEIRLLSERSLVQAQPSTNVRKVGVPDELLSVDSPHRPGIRIVCPSGLAKVFLRILAHTTTMASNAAVDCGTIDDILPVSALWIYCHLYTVARMTPATAELMNLPMANHILGIDIDAALNSEPQLAGSPPHLLSCMMST
jgi:hypothetical protein